LPTTKTSAASGGGLYSSKYTRAAQTKKMTEITVGMPIQSASILWLVETGLLRSALDPRRYLMPKNRSRP
jgi:hypothetical protein